MKYAVYMIAAMFYACTATGQTMGDEISAYLAQNNIQSSIDDWSVCQPEGGVDFICRWNQATLGTVPSQSQLQATIPALNNIAQGAQYRNIAAAGINVSCATGSTVCAPSIAGTYTAPVPDIPGPNSAAQQNITSIESSIAAGRGLPGGGSTLGYFDSNGMLHQFSAAQWGEFAQALMNYSYALQTAHFQLLQGQPATWPSNQIQLQ